MNMQCFVYKWTHIPTLKWYVGSRTNKKAHLNDGYICSSKTVKKLINANPNQWQRTIIATGSKEEMYNLETEILQLFDARNDIRSFNRHNNHEGLCPGGWNKGLTGIQVAWNKGLTGNMSHSKGNKHAVGMTPWNKDSTIIDPVLKEKYRQAALSREKAKRHSKGE